MLIKMMRLGWVVELWRGAIDGNLYATVISPKDQDLRESLLCCEDVDSVPTHEAAASIETRLKRFCLDEGL